MSDKETPEVSKPIKDRSTYTCDYCKKTKAIVTTNKLYWCANCYTSYVTRMLAHPRRGASH